MSLEKNISEIKQEFSFFYSWEEKYEYLIDLGRSIPTMDNSLKNEKNIVRGCQAKVWLVCKIHNRQLFLQGDSDAIITKGLVGLLINIFNNCNVDEIVNSNNQFLDELGLNKHLSMTRSNGIIEMIAKIRSFCSNNLSYE
tara:strand:- start:259 stop:678 length:420 start_codon:yes stop_codon:yes gene_type:complete